MCNAEDKQRIQVIRQLLMAVGTLVAVNAQAASSEEDWDRAPEVVAAANSWHEGDQVPLELRRYYRAPGDMPTRSILSP